MEHKLLRHLTLFVLAFAVHLGVSAQRVHRVPNAVADTLYLESFIENTDMWDSGDVIMLIDEEYWVNGTIDLFQGAVIIGDPSLGKRPVIHFYDNGFRPKEDSISIILKDFVADGYDPNDGKNAGALLRFDQGDYKYYNEIMIDNVEAYDFVGGLLLHTQKDAVYESIKLTDVNFHDMNLTNKSWAIDPSLNVVKELKVYNSTFANISGFLKNPYFNKDGAGAHGLVDQKIYIDQNTFYNIGDQNNALIQVNDPTDGSVSLTFTNNIVSGVLNPDNARPFRINTAAGSFTFDNNIIHNFNTASSPATNLDSLLNTPEYDNVISVTGLSTDDPGFSRPGAGEFYVFSELGAKKWRQSAERIIDLEGFIEDTSRWEAGVPIVLTEPEYWIHGTIDIFQEIEVVGANPNKRPILHFYDNGFRPKADSISITLKHLIMDGYNPNEDKHAGAVLRFDQGAFKYYKDIFIDNVEAYDFIGGVMLHTQKDAYYETVRLRDVYFHDMNVSNKSWAIDPGLNVVEELSVNTSTFANISGFLKNPYFNKDGAGAHRQVAQQFDIDHCTFYNIGDQNNALIQINDPNDGSVTLTFSNNLVSGVLNPDNARPFRLNTAAGTFTFNNNVFHDFNTNSSLDTNLDSIVVNSAYDGVVIIDELVTDDPKYVDADRGNFTPRNFTVYTGDNNNEPQGDPRWIRTQNLQDVDLEAFIEDTSLWTAGEPILLTEKEYWVHGTIDVFQELVVEGADANNPPVIHFYDNGFRPKEDSISITLKNFIADGYDPNDNKNAPALLRFDQGAFKYYNDILIENVEAYDFVGGVLLHTGKDARYESVTLNNVNFHDMNFTNKSWAIDPSLNAVDQLTISNSTFANISGFLKNPYFNKDGAGALGQVAQQIDIDHCTFYNIGDQNNALIQVNDPNDGSVTLTFSNNIVSGVLNPENARPFRINVAAGTFTFTDNVFHDFNTNSSLDTNLDSIIVNSAYDGVVIVDELVTDDPKFTDADYGNFTALNLKIYSGATDGGAQGDPRWVTGEALQDLDLEAFIEDISLWEAGVPIVLNKPEYWVHGTIDVFQELVIEGADANNPPLIHFYDNGFRPKEDSISITLKNFVADGYDPNDGKNAPALLRFDQGAYKYYYDILIENVEAYDFVGGLLLHTGKDAVYESVTINNVYFHDMNLTNKSWAIDPSLNVVEQLTVTNSTFANISGFLKNPYFNKDGAGAHGLVAQQFDIDHCTFFNIGDQNNALIQVNDPNDGSVTLTFTNNIVNGILNAENARPFRLNVAAGTFTFNNNTVFAFNSTSSPDTNLDAIMVNTDYDGVVVVNALSTDDPQFLNENHYYYGNASIATASTTGGEIGDPRWGSVDDAPQFIRIKHPGMVTADDVIQLEVDATVSPIVWSMESMGGEAHLSDEGKLTALGEGKIKVTASLVAETAKDVAYIYRNQALESGASPADYDVVISMLDKDPNFNVTAIASDNISVDLNTFDLVIISESLSSGDDVLERESLGGPTGNGAAFYADLTVPFIYNKTYALKSGKNVVTNSTGSVVEPSDFNITIPAASQDHPIFSGIDFSRGNEIAIYTESSNDQGGEGTKNLNPMYDFHMSSTGTLLATADAIAEFNADSAVLINDIPAGTTFGEATDAPTQARMVAFAFAYGPMVKDGGKNVTPEGLAIWRNAAYYLTGMTPPSVVNIEIKKRIIPVTSLEIFALESTINSAGSVKVVAKVLPANATDREVDWSLNNGSLGEVKRTGLGVINFEAAASGTVTITGKARGGVDLTASVDVTIEQAVTEISVASAGDVTTVPTGATLQFTATVLPEEAVNKDVTWSINVGDTIATISETGLLTAVGAGNLTVSAIAADGSEVSGTFDLEVVLGVTSIEVTSAGGVTEIAPSETLQMSATVMPAEAADASVTWSVDDETVATISTEGLLSAVADGEVTVTATANDGTGVTGTFDVTVASPLSVRTVSDLAELYPNPSTSYFDLKVNGSADVQIIGLSGQVHLQKVVTGAARINVESLMPGLYMVKLTANNETQTIKLAKR